MNRVSSQRWNVAQNSEWCVSSVICIIPSVLTAVSRLAGCGRSDDMFWSLLGACGVVQMMPTSGEAGMIHHIGHATTCIYINNNQIIKHATDIRTPTTREIIEWLTLSFLGKRDLIWDLETLWRNVMRLMMTYELCPRCHDTDPHWGGALATHHDAWKPLGRPRCIRSHGLTALLQISPYLQHRHTSCPAENETSSDHSTIYYAVHLFQISN